MEPRIITRESFFVMGVVGHFQSATENFEPLWNEYMKVHQQIEPWSISGGYYGIYLSADHARPIDYLAGLAVQQLVKVPDGLQACEVPKALYAVFECSFKDIGSAYNFIWEQWLQLSAYQQDISKLGFDYYPPATTGGESPMEIWFPVKKRV